MKRRGIVVALILLGVGSATAVSAQNLGALAAPEQQAMSDTLQYALENNPTSQGADWVNPDTGRSGAVVPVKTYTGPDGAPCREFISTIIIAGQEEQGYGRACRQPDGSWQIVSDAGASRVPPPQTTVNVYNPPERYYYYPSGFYAPFNIFLSFGLVHRHGHSYPGRFYLDSWQFRNRYPAYYRTRIYRSPGGHDSWWRGEWEHRERERGRHDFGDDRRRDRGRDRDRGRGRH